MSQISQTSTNELWTDGRRIELTLTKTSPTTARISWVVPTITTAYDGAVVVLADEPLNSSNFPEDGTRYTPSSNWTAPADTIGNAHVVAAFYGYFGDDPRAQTYVDVTNLDPDTIYYAKIHAASNVLQYFTIGTQSYPLESSRIEKKSDTYAGSIPISVDAPENPYNGQVYYDPTSNLVLVWNSDVGAWSQVTQKTASVGERLPIQKYQLLYNTAEAALKFFDGQQWVESTPSNTRVKLSSLWVSFAGATTIATLPDPATPGEFIYYERPARIGGPKAGELKVYTAGNWFIPSSDLVHVFDGVDWVPVVIGDRLFADRDPDIPEVGDFFYQKSSRDLFVWSGTDWVKADTAEEGTPTTEKIGIGNDGSYNERLRLIKILQSQLGWPQLCVELTEEQFNIAVDNAIETFRQRADNAYAHRYISISLRRGQDIYYLNDPRNKTNKIVNVLKIHRINMLGLNALSSETGLYAQAFYNQLFTGQMIDLTAIHLFHQLSETFEKIFAGNLMFTWNEATRELLILRRLNHTEERVILEVVVERTEQELLVDRWIKQWLQAWAESEMLEMLGLIRSKYATLPGPNGGITLNGDQLIALASEKQQDLQRQLLDYEVGNGGVNFANTAFFIG